MCWACLATLQSMSAWGIEYWTDHPEHTGYRVSTLGRVKSPDHVTSDHGGRDGSYRCRVFKGRLLTPVPNGKNGYPSAYVAGKLRRTHHLALESFVGPRPPGYEALHWDDVSTNCRLANLRWGTRADNEADRKRNRLARQRHYQARERLLASA
jgi:hypothetical protein